MPTKAELFKHTENKKGRYVRIDNAIVCRDKRSKSTYRYINQFRHHVAKIRVDNGLVQNSSAQKCDWLLINWDSAHSFFVEIKGSDVKTAIEQIKATLNLLWSDINKMGINVAHIRIVVTRVPVPNLVSQKKQELKIYLKRYGSGTPDIQSQEMVDTF